jgi:hypothetical protein
MTTAPKGSTLQIESLYGNEQLKPLPVRTFGLASPTKRHQARLSNWVVLRHPVTPHVTAYALESQESANKTSAIG